MQSRSRSTPSAGVRAHALLAYSSAHAQNRSPSSHANAIRSKEDRMPHQDLVALAREAMEAWNSHDPAQVAACCSEDVVFEGDAVGSPLVGGDALRQFAKMYMDGFSDLHFEYDVPLAADDRAVIE